MTHAQSKPRQSDLFTEKSVPPATAPFVRGSDTSAEAAERIEPVLNRMSREIMALMREHGALGATCDRIEEQLNMRHQTASARVRELVLAGLLVDSGMRRNTRSGRRAAVWRTR